MEDRCVIVYGRGADGSLCPNTLIQLRKLEEKKVPYEYVDVDEIPDRIFLATPTTEVYDMQGNLVRRVVGLSYQLEKRYEEVEEE